jgi:hypothetical protein
VNAVCLFGSRICFGLPCKCLCSGRGGGLALNCDFTCLVDEKVKDQNEKEHKI